MTYPRCRRRTQPAGRTDSRTYPGRLDRPGVEA